MKPTITDGSPCRLVKNFYKSKKVDREDAAGCLLTAKNNYCHPQMLLVSTSLFASSMINLYSFVEREQLRDLIFIEQFGKQYLVQWYRIDKQLVLALWTTQFTYSLVWIKRVNLSTLLRSWPMQLGQPMLPAGKLLTHPLLVSFLDGTQL